MPKGRSALRPKLDDSVVDDVAALRHNQGSYRSRLFIEYTQGHKPRPCQVHLSPVRFWPMQSYIFDVLQC